MVHCKQQHQYVLSATPMFKMATFIHLCTRDGIVTQVVKWLSPTFFGRSLFESKTGEIPNSHIFDGWNSLF